MSLFGKIIKGGFSAVRTVAKVPGLMSVAKAVPIVGTVATVGSLGYDLYKGAQAMGGGMPSLPGNMPMLPGMPGTPAIVGQRGLFANDPNIVAALQPFAISKGNLKMYYRSPLKGYVVVYDKNGDPFALPKDMARKHCGWKPSKKPPISVGDWEAVKRADRTVKHVRKIMTTMTRVDNAIGKDGKVKIRGGKKK